MAHYDHSGGRTEGKRHTILSDFLGKSAGIDGINVSRTRSLLVSESNQPIWLTQSQFRLCALHAKEEIPYPFGIASPTLQKNQLQYRQAQPIYLRLFEPRWDPSRHRPRQYKYRHHCQIVHLTVQKLLSCAQQGKKFESKNADGSVNSFTPKMDHLDFLCPVQANLKFLATDPLPAGYEPIRAWPTTKKPRSLKDVSVIPSTDFHCIAIPR